MRRLTAPLCRTWHRVRRFGERTSHALDLYQRLGFPWADAWRIAGTWQ